MTLEQEYLLLVVLACCGVVQVAASYGNLRGLLLFGDSRLSALVGLGLTVGSLAWFFWDGGRNINDTEGGLAGASQFGFLVLGAFLALLLTFLATSLTNLRRGLSIDTKDGLSSLRETTFVQAVSSNLGSLWKLYCKLTKRYSSG